LIGYCLKKWKKQINSMYSIAKDHREISRIFSTNDWSWNERCFVLNSYQLVAEFLWWINCDSAHYCFCTVSKTIVKQSKYVVKYVAYLTRYKRIRKCVHTTWKMTYRIFYRRCRFGYILWMKLKEQKKNSLYNLSSQVNQWLHKVGTYIRMFLIYCFKGIYLFVMMWVRNM